MARDVAIVRMRMTVSYANGRYFPGREVVLAGTPGKGGELTQQYLVFGEVVLLSTFYSRFLITSTMCSSHCHRHWLLCLFSLSHHVHLEAPSFLELPIPETLARTPAKSPREYNLYLSNFLRHIRWCALDSNNLYER